jgi:hypothetical protein
MRRGIEATHAPLRAIFRCFVGALGREWNPARFTQSIRYSIDLRVTFRAYSVGRAGAEPNLARGAAGRIEEVNQVMQHRRVIDGSIEMKRYGTKLK